MITNANARISILSITASCREYRLFVAHDSSNAYSVTMRPRPRSRLGRGWNLGSWFSWKSL